MDDFEEFGLTTATKSSYNDRAILLQKKRDKVFDLDVPIEEWIQCAVDLHNFDYDTCEEAISDLCASYVENGISSIRLCIETILRTSVFSFLSKYKCAEALGNLFYMLELLEEYRKNTKDDVNFTLYCDQLFQMISWNEIPTQTIEEHCHFVFSTKTVPWVTKYKLFKGLCDFRITNRPMICSVGKTLLTNSPLSNYTVLCLQLFRFDDSTLTSILSRAKQSRDIKVKSDIYDQMLDYPSIKTRALTELKKIGEGMKTLDSSQNVHMVTADVNGWLEKLSKIHPESNYNECTTHLKESWETSTNPEDFEKILYSFQRIEMDNKLYGKLYYKLTVILHRVISKINNHPCKDELINRLKEEMIEMSQWCSTGHLVRLMNIFSGYEDSSITVDPAIELRTVINKRVEKYMDGLKGKYITRKVNKGKFVFASTSIDEEFKHLSMKSTFDYERKEEEVRKEDADIEEVDKSKDLYEIVMDAWMDGDQAILQEHFNKELSMIHDEVYNDYVGQGIMNAQEFTENYRDIINKLFVV